MFRQRSRRYLFSNSLAPAIVGASLKVFERIENNTSLLDKLEENTNHLRSKIEAVGFGLTGALCCMMQNCLKLLQINY